MSVGLVSIVLTLLFDIPMQEVKSIIMESSDSLSLESEQSKKSFASEENHNSKKVVEQESFEDEELNPGGWNWNRGTFTKMMNPEPSEYEENGFEEPYRSSRYKRQDIRRQTIIRSDAYDEWDDRGSRRTSRSEEHSMDGGRNSRSDYRYSDAGLDDDLDHNYRHPRERYFSGGYTRSPMRDLDAPVFRRSVSRERMIPREKEQEISTRDYNNKPIITISKEEDYQHTRSPRSLPRFSDQQRSLSSESESDIIGSRKNSVNYSRHSPAEPRIASENEWEEELRIRRNRYYHDRVSSQERERVPPPVAEEDTDEWNTLRRRSSAEGKMALLKEPLRPGNMELWTVSKLQLGSSQEPDDDDLDEEMYLQQRREYREQGPPLREESEGEEEQDAKPRFTSESLPASFEEEDDTVDLEFRLRNSKRITVQDLSKLSQDEESFGDNSWNRLDVKSNSSGLFKRESIVKSQASEEDPEYLLPERPKLVEQEQEHPFKKAWQMQKSRSEEEGSVSFIAKEQNASTTILEKQKEDSKEKDEEENKDNEGGQSEEIIAPDVTCDVTIVWQACSNESEDTKSSTKSEVSSAGSSSRFDWPDEEEQFERHKIRRTSDEENWDWTERDT